MAASTTRTNKVALVLLPVCAFTHRVIKNEKLKVSVYAPDGVTPVNVRLVIKDNGYLVFSSAGLPETEEIRVFLEIPGYLSGSSIFPLVKAGTPLQEHRVYLYPTRSLFLGESYTAICGKAPAGSRILAYSSEEETTWRLMADAKAQTGEISLYSGSDAPEGRVIAAAEETGSLLTLLEIEELAAFPDRYRIKTPLAVNLKRFSTKLYPAAITQPAPDGTYFLPLDLTSEEQKPYVVILQNAGTTETKTLEILPGRENRLDYV